MNRLRELRQASGILQKELAEYLNTTQATLSNWESGKHEPDTDSLLRIAKYFEVPTDYLLGMSDNRFLIIRTKKEPTPRERLANELLTMLEGVPNEKLSKVMNAFQSMIDAMV